MEQAIAELAQKIEPLRPRLLGNNQIQIDSIPDIPEQDNSKSMAAQAVVPWRTCALPGYVCQNLKRLHDILRHIELRCAFDVR